MSYYQLYNRYLYGWFVRNGFYVSPANSMFESELIWDWEQLFNNQAFTSSMEIKALLVHILNNKREENKEKRKINMRLCSRESKAIYKTWNLEWNSKKRNIECVLQCYDFVFVSRNWRITIEFPEVQSIHMYVCASVHFRVCSCKSGVHEWVNKYSTRSFCDSLWNRNQWEVTVQSRSSSLHT